MYNVAVGDRTTLNSLFRLLAAEVASIRMDAGSAEPRYDEFRPGDVRHSEADVSAIERELGYEASHRLEEGLGRTVSWYADQLERVGATEGARGQGTRALGGSA